jgi:hypothetical protein
VGVNQRFQINNYTGLYKQTLNKGTLKMAQIKKYNLAGVSANVELGKQGSYITGTANAIGFYANGGSLQKLEIANATVSTQAITKAQLDDVAADLVQHITMDFDYNHGTSNVATVSAGARIFSVTVDVPSAWSGASSSTSFVEIGDSSNGSRFIRAQDVDVTKVGQYHSQYQYEYTSGGTLQLSVTPGAASAGSGTLSILVAADSVTVSDYGSISQAQNSNSDLGNIS